MKDRESNVKAISAITAQMNDAFANVQYLNEPIGTEWEENTIIASSLEVLNGNINFDEIVTKYFYNPEIKRFISNLYDSISSQMYSVVEIGEQYKDSVISALERVVTLSSHTLALVSSWWFIQNQTYCRLEGMNALCTSNLFYGGLDMNNASAYYQAKFTIGSRDQFCSASISNTDWAHNFIAPLAYVHLPKEYAKLIYTLCGFAIDCGNDQGTRRRALVKIHPQDSGAFNGAYELKYGTVTAATNLLSQTVTTIDNLMSQYPILKRMLAALEADDLFINLKVATTDGYIFKDNNGFDFTRVLDSNSVNTIQADQSIVDLFNTRLKHRFTVEEHADNGYTDETYPKSILHNVTSQSVYRDGMWITDDTKIDSVITGSIINFDYLIMNYFYVSTINTDVVKYNTSTTPHTATLTTVYRLLPYHVEFNLYNIINDATNVSRDDLIKVGKEVLDYTAAERTASVGLSWYRPDVRYSLDTATTPLTINLPLANFAYAVWPDMSVLPESIADSLNSNILTSLFIDGLPNTYIRIPRNNKSDKSNGDKFKLKKYNNKRSKPRASSKTKHEEVDTEQRK